MGGVLAPSPLLYVVAACCDSSKPICTAAMSGDDQTSGPGKTELPTVDGCGIYTTSVEEGQSKEDPTAQDLNAPANTDGAEEEAGNSTECATPRECVEIASPSSAPAVALSPETPSTVKKKKKKKEGRCPVEGCKKKIGLTGFECRCGLLFCAIHRYSDAHACTFDYKALARDQISAANPIVAASKFNKI